MRTEHTKIQEDVSRKKIFEVIDGLEFYAGEYGHHHVAGDGLIKLAQKLKTIQAEALENQEGYGGIAHDMLEKDAIIASFLEHLKWIDGQPIWLGNDTNYISSFRKRYNAILDRTTELLARHHTKGSVE